MLYANLLSYVYTSYENLNLKYLNIDIVCKYKKKIVLNSSVLKLRDKILQIVIKTRDFLFYKNNSRHNNVCNPELIFKEKVQ